MALNKVMLIGNVGNDPEVRYLDQNAQNPSRVATIRLATSERRRDQNNELKEYTEWHTVVAWGRNAELVEKYVRKGAQLYVEGSLRTRSWDGRDGQKHYVTEVRAEVIQMLSRRDASSAAAGGQHPHQWELRRLHTGPYSRRRRQPWICRWTTISRSENFFRDYVR